MEAISRAHRDERCLREVGHRCPQNWGSHIEASHSRQPLVKGERLVRYEVNAVIANQACKQKCFYSFEHVAETVKLPREQTTSLAQANSLWILSMALVGNCS